MPTNFFNSLIKHGANKLFDRLTPTIGNFILGGADLAKHLIPENLINTSVNYLIKKTMKMPSSMDYMIDAGLEVAADLIKDKVEDLFQMEKITDSPPQSNAAFGIGDMGSSPSEPNSLDFAPAFIGDQPDLIEKQVLVMKSKKKKAKKGKKAKTRKVTTKPKKRTKSMPAVPVMVEPVVKTDRISQPIVPAKEIKNKNKNKNRIYSVVI